MRSISATLKEACQTKIDLPNAAALNDDARAVYQKFGLNERQVRILSQATPKKDYYYSSSCGNRLFELGLDELALAYCAGTSKERQNLVSQIIKKSHSTTDFNIRYLKELGIGWPVESLESLTQLNEKIERAG